MSGQSSFVVGLAETYERCLGSEELFTHKRILFVGSESYDGPAITVLQGLDELDFEVHTIGKDNINSWFCNTVIDDPGAYEYDFVLSNLHWGTRWSHYERFDLGQYPNVLIDGDDNPWLCEDWRCKYERHREEYRFDPPAAVKEREMMPYRWVEPVGEYEPDVIFTSQKRRTDTETTYLPFGIQREYLKWDGTRPATERHYDLTNIDGPGTTRQWMRRFLSVLNPVSRLPGDRLDLLPGKVFNGTARGRRYIPDGLTERIDADDNVHSYHRWVMYEDYFETLRDSKMVVMVSPDKWTGWESKRHYEALACGCLLLWVSPPTDVSEYPMWELCEFGLCDSYADFLQTYRYLYYNPDIFEQVRKRAYERALKYFTPKPIARYFLDNIDAES